MGKLIVFAGLPGSGKSTLAREIARQVGAVWLRVDSMDQAIWASGTAPSDLRDWTYRAAQAVAEDNLRLGRDVIGDCVNDWKEGRDRWQELALRAGVEVLWVETVCTDPVEHQHRIETRESDIPGLVLPDWKAVTAREYHPLDHDHLTIDTARQTISESLEIIIAAL